jgi:ornithine carbamoyltransferase
VLADLMTIREVKGSLKGLKMCFIGDGNNMANSLMVGALKTGMSFSIACPKDYKPDEKLVKWAQSEEFAGKFQMNTSCKEAAENADVIYTDVWASMGEEGEKDIREKAFKGYQVNKELMAVAKKDCMVLHCLPAHRGEEITDEVFEAHADEIFEEAENRLHAQKAVLCKLMK